MTDPPFWNMWPSSVGSSSGDVSKRFLAATGAADPTTPPFLLDDRDRGTDRTKRASELEWQVWEPTRRRFSFVGGGGRTAAVVRPGKTSKCCGRAFWDQSKSPSFEETAAVDPKRQARNGQESSRRRHPFRSSSESGRGLIGEAVLRPGRDGALPYPLHIHSPVNSLFRGGGGGGDPFPDRALRQQDGGAPIPLVVWSPLVRPPVARPKEAVHCDKYKDLLTVCDLSTCVPACRGYGRIS
jgi:hypothetical protein